MKFTEKPEDLHSFYTLTQFEQIMDELRNELTVVTTNGTFDLLHPGHIYTFQQAKRLGDILIVGMNSDASVRAYKGENRPINDERTRGILLSSSKYVDYVILFDETDPRLFLDFVKPKYHVKSKSGFKGLEKDVVERNGGQIVLLEDFPNYSSTDVIERCFQSRYRELKNEC